MNSIRYVVTSDCALTVVFSDEINEQVNIRVSAFADSLKQSNIKGITDICPAYSSVMISFDPSVISLRKLKRKAAALFRRITDDAVPAGKLWEIPVCYGGKYGEDLEETAKFLGISSGELVKRHSGKCYRIYMLGFLPGFAYLGGLDKTIAAPRLSAPRTAIPAGSVGIGGEQTGIYPLRSPGGWRLIGTTPLDVYNPVRRQPVLYSSGDYLKFVPVSEEKFLEIKNLVSAGKYEYICGDYNGS